MSDRETFGQARKRQHIARSFAFALALTLSACGPRDAAYDPSHFPVNGTVVPPDVLVPSVPQLAQNGSFEFNGLYIEAGALTCCWVAPHATLLVKKRGFAKTLVAGFRVPALPRFANGQKVSIHFTGYAQPSATQAMEPGEQYMMKLAVPASLRAHSGYVKVDVECAVDFVPSRDNVARPSVFTLLHLRPADVTSDARKLGVMMLYMYFQ